MTIGLLQPWLRDSMGWLGVCSWWTPGGVQGQSGSGSEAGASIACMRACTRSIIEVTTPRTIFDLAATESADVVANLLRGSEYRQLHDRLSLWDLVERYPGRRGVCKVRTALERLKEEPSGRRRSRLEERFVPFLPRHQLPQPRFNDWILLGGKRYQVDCHWPGTGEIVELDGWEGHGTRAAFREDRARDRALRVAGYSITRLTWNQLDDEPEVIASDLRALIYKRP